MTLRVSLQFACQVSIVDLVMNVNAEAGRSLQLQEHNIPGVVTRE